MTTVDWVVLSFIALWAALGFWRGVVSQVMAIVGILLAYFFAPTLGRTFGGEFEAILGSSRFLAEILGMFLIGAGMYFGLRVIGFGIEKLFLQRIKEFKSLNRFGGAGFGALKAVLIVFVAFTFLALVPRPWLKSVAPKIVECKTYEIAARFNPVLDQASLERMRSMRTRVMDKDQVEKLRKDPKFKELLHKHGMGGALDDPRFVDQLARGDYGRLKRNDDFQKLMKEEELETLLENLEKEDF